MTPRRRRTAVLGALAALLSLTACQKPTPIVTVQSGTTVVKSNAQIWCFGGVPDAECRDDEATVKATKLEATPGQLVSIDVSKEVADRGWVLEQIVAGSPQQSGAYPPRDDHYFTLTMPPLTTELRIRALDGQDEADPTQVTGTWVFVLEPRT